MQGGDRAPPFLNICTWWRQWSAPHSSLLYPWEKLPQYGNCLHYIWGQHVAGWTWDSYLLTQFSKGSLILGWKTCIDTWCHYKEDAILGNLLYFSFTGSRGHLQTILTLFLASVWLLLAQHLFTVIHEHNRVEAWPPNCALPSTSFWI